MSKFFFMSDTGDGLGLALHLKDHGHDVACWIRDRRSKLNYENLIAKPKNWESFITPETVIVFDSSGGGRTGDRLRARGHFVFMGSVFADSLELDRDIAFSFMEQVGIKIPRHESFHDWEAGRSFVQSEKGRWVFKPSRELAKLDDHVSSYVSSDEEDLIEMLHYYESLASHAADYELQQFVEGVAVSTEGWFNGESFMTPFNHTVERKQISNCDLGPSGGCSGNLVWRVSDSNHVIEQGVELLAPILREFDYRGPIDLNAIVNDDGVWGLELTPRFGYDALPSFLELYEGDVGDSLIAPIARNEKPKEFVMKAGYASALRVNVPPYPSDQFHHEGNVPVRGFDRKDRAHLFFYDVMLDERNKLVTSPAYGSVVAITGHGFTPEQAFEEPLAIAKRAKIPDKMYRTDLASELATDIARFNRIVSIRSKVRVPDE
jgi:phosphoribosylamine--glycine ligase